MNHLERVRSVRRGSRARIVKIAGGLNVLAALWLIGSPFGFGYTEVTAATRNDIIVGVLVLVMSWVRVARPAVSSGLSLANALLGFWLVAAPFALGYSRLAISLWNDVVVGLVIALLAGWSSVVTPDPVGKQSEW